ncbi:unnamed protein product [Ectocarpus sp. 8 AP-2014]
MSGELLRRCAIFGDVDKIKNLLEQGSNPCSMDDFGLSALHYASWNGHVRCVEILCINDLGHDGAGLQRSCIDLRSIKGWTPLHLAASDGVNGVKCIDALLRAGADRSIRDVDGKTALEAAIYAGRDDCARALNLEIGNAKNLADYRKKMETNLKVQRAQRMLDTPGEPQKRRAPKPHSLMMHEDEIKPFSEKNFTGKHAAETIRNLVIATEQAGINENRRKGLKNAQDVAIAKAMEQKFI